MADIKINHEELLKKILRDPTAAVAKQLIIPAAVTTAIMSKRALGIFDRIDQLQLAAETLSAIKYIAEHDYLAYLTFLNRFDLIREIFWDRELFGPQLRRLDRLDREKDHVRNQQHLFDEQARQALINRQYQEQLAREQQRRQMEENALLNMDLYGYYMHLEQEIHNDFHIKQIQILDAAYKGRIERISRALAIAEIDPSISAEDREALSTLRHNYQEEYNAVNRMPTHKPDGSIDHAALKRKSEASIELDNKYKLQLKNILDKYPHHEQLAQINREEAEATQAYEGELVQNQEVRDQRLEEVRPHLEATRQIAKGDLEQSMDTSIKCIDNCDLSGFADNRQHNEFRTLVKNLKEYRAELSQTNDNARIKELTNQFSEDLVRVRTMIKPSMLNSEDSQKLEREIRTLSELNNRINTGRAVLSPPPVPLSIPLSEPPPSYEQAVSNDSPPTYSEATGNFVIAENPPLYEDVIQEPTTERSTSFWRNQVSSIRTEAMEQEVQEELSSQSDFDDDFTTELDSEYQDSLDEQLPKIQKNLVTINKVGNLSVEEKQTVQQTIELCKEIFPTIRDQVVVSKMKQLKDNFDVLKEKSKELKKFTAELDSIIASLPSNHDSPRLRH